MNRGFEIFLMVTGATVWLLVLAAIAYLLILLSVEALIAWWQIVRIRQVIKRRSVIAWEQAQEVTLWEWIVSIWRVVTREAIIEYAGIRVPRNPFQRLGHNHRR